jgi:membrane dipeptidase
MTKTRFRMNRREAIGLLAGATCTQLPIARASAASFTESDYQRATVIDAQGGFDLALGIERSALETASSGLTAMSLTMGWVGNAPDRMESVIKDIADASGWITAYPNRFIHVLRGSDLRAAKSSRRTGLIYNVQDTTALEGDIARVRLLKNLGVRIIQLTYNKRNLCGDGCLEPGNAGLSDFGRQVVSEINSEHVLLDLSHGGPRTISEAVQASQVPVAVTHTGCRALVDHQRNLYDDQMREIADRGGVIGIYFIAYLRSGIGQPALNARGEDLIAHLEHAADVCGEDHVGIGTDGDVSTLVIDERSLAVQKRKFEERTRQGIATAGEGPDVFNYVPEYNTPRRLLTLADDLAKRGWSSRRIEKLIGGNFARLFSETWDP